MEIGFHLQISPLVQVSPSFCDQSRTAVTGGLCPPFPPSCCLPARRTDWGECYQLNWWGQQVVHLYMNVGGLFSSIKWPIVNPVECFLSWFCLVVLSPSIKFPSYLLPPLTIFHRLSEYPQGLAVLQFIDGTSIRSSEPSGIVKYVVSLIETSVPFCSQFWLWQIN